MAMRTAEDDEEVVRVLTNKEHLTGCSTVPAISPHPTGSTVPGIIPHPTDRPVAASPQRTTPPRSYTSRLLQSGECADLCSESSSRSSSPGSILQGQCQRHKHLPKLPRHHHLHKQQQQQQQQSPSQSPLQQQEGTRGLMKFRSLQGSPVPSAPHPWSLPGSSGSPPPGMPIQKSADPLCLPHSHARSHQPHVSESSGVISRASSNLSNMSCPKSARAPPKRSVTFSPLSSSLPSPSSLPNLASQAAAARRAKAGSPMRVLPQLQQQKQQQQQQQAKAAPHQHVNEVASSSTSCPISSLAVSSQPQRSFKRFAHDGTMSGTLLASAEQKLLELAALEEGESACHLDWQAQEMGPPSHGSRPAQLDAATQRGLQPSRSEASLFSLPAVTHRNTQHRSLQPDCAQQSPASTKTEQQQQQQQQQHGSIAANVHAPCDPNTFADLDSAMNDADALQLCIGILRRTEETHASVTDSPRQSRLSWPSRQGTLSDRSSMEEGCGLRPRECASYDAAPATKARQDGAASVLEPHHKVALQGSSAGSVLSSGWRSCSALLPSECSADSLTYQEQPQHQHSSPIMQCRSQDGLHLVDGARRRARRKGNMCNAQSPHPPQDVASTVSKLSPQSSSLRVPPQKQSSKCLLAINAVAFHEEAAEFAEKEFMAVSQKAHGSLESESSKFMMAIAQLQTYRPIFISPDQRPKAGMAKSDTDDAATRAPDGPSREQIMRMQHEEAVARMLSGEDDCRSKYRVLLKQKQVCPEEDSGQDLDKERSGRGECRQGMPEGDAGVETEPTVSEQGVPGVVHGGGEQAGAEGAAGKMLADEVQEAVAASKPAAARAAPAAAATTAAAAAVTGWNGVNWTQSQADKEPWKLWKMSASADMEGGFALGPGEFSDEKKPPLWKPLGPIHPDYYSGCLGPQDPPADEKLPTWKPVQPLNPDHYDGSWGSKDIPKSVPTPADVKLPAWKPVQPLNPDHYDGSWGSKRTEHSRSPCVSPELWKPFWHTNPVDLSDLRPVDHVPEKKNKPLQPMWRL